MTDPERPLTYATPWMSRLLRKKYSGTSLPVGTALSDPPENLDPDTAKAALEQVNKRLEAQTATKISTEARAMTLSGQCVTLCIVVAGATLAEMFGPARPPFIAAGTAMGVCLLIGVFCAYRSIRPRHDIVLPGRLPDELWDDLVAPGMEGAEFMARLMKGLQEPMLRNEIAQADRAKWLSRALWWVTLSVPVAIILALALYGCLLAEGHFSF